MQYFSQIKNIRETERGTDLIVHIPGEQVGHKITKYRNGSVINSEIRIDDNRTITADQRKKIYATIRDIAMYTGDDPEYLKEFLKFDYCGHNGEEYFSLSNCSISTAREFINFIIDFILKYDIPLSEKAVVRTDDIDTYLYMCVKYRKCAITGRANADIHHCIGSRIGMDGNRKKISNKGRELIALSREWHTKVHQEGEKEIFKLYKVYGITVDDETLKELKLSQVDLT